MYRMKRLLERREPEAFHGVDEELAFVQPHLEIAVDDALDGVCTSS